jgi:hypothetical protein
MLDATMVRYDGARLGDHESVSSAGETLTHVRNCDPMLNGRLVSSIDPFSRSSRCNARTYPEGASCSLAKMV